MGTLTADVPRLDGHCPHKLATSCRLTSTLNCCACADDRPHSVTYSIYIDGLGMVPRGTRWQNYCWCCQVFWDNRIQCTDPPIRPSQTRIPLIPDQTEFLERWFEFHQGYRLVKAPDGSERRVAVLGEQFREVDPGFLPRTLNQLRAGQVNNRHRRENRFRRERLPSEEPQDNATPHQSIENALDSLLAEVEAEDEQVGESVSTAQGAQQSESAPEEGGEPNTQAPSSSNTARQAIERFTRIFGTRDDIQRDDYQSPLSALYATRRDTQTEPSTNEPEEASTNPVVHMGQPVLRARDTTDPFELRVQTTAYPYAQTRATAAPQIQSRAQPLPQREINGRTQNNNISNSANRGNTTPTANPLATRPPPLQDEQLIVKLNCKVCYEQLAEIACLPCGHMVMCRWCADAHMPLRHSNVPVEGSKCPICRRRVRQRVRVFVV